MNEEELKEVEALEEGQHEKVQDSKAETRLFTQEEVNKFVTDRVKREKAKYSDYEELKEKALQFDRIKESTGGELQKIQEENTRLKEELKAIRAAEELQAIKVKIAKDADIPIELLTEGTEEKLLAQAVNLSNYKKNIAPNYQPIKDAGEPFNTNLHRSTRDIFKEYADKVF